LRTRIDFDQAGAPTSVLPGALALVLRWAFAANPSMKAGFIPRMADCTAWKVFSFEGGSLTPVLSND
jgi:hypothetical protein